MHVGKKLQADGANRLAVELDRKVGGVADVGGAQVEPRARVRLRVGVREAVSEVEPNLPVVGVADQRPRVGAPPRPQYQRMNSDHRRRAAVSSVGGEDAGYGWAVAPVSRPGLSSFEPSSGSAPLIPRSPFSGRFHSASCHPLSNAATRWLEKPWSWMPLNSSPPRL